MTAASRRRADGVGDGAPTPPEVPTDRRTEIVILVAFGVTGTCGLALLILYALGGQTQLEGLLLFAALGGVGVGIVLWAQRLMPTPVRVEKRSPIGGGPEVIADLEETLLEEAGFTRRKLLLAGLAGALGSLAAALAIPILSLGPAPGRSLFVTSWQAGRRLAPEGGEPITADALPVGGVVTVFPDGDATDPNAATLLVRIGRNPGAGGGAGAGTGGGGGEGAGAGGGAAGTPGPGASEAPTTEEFVAVSKICTHAGCPVGLYRATDHVLICPCHQSEFDVLDGARPINGPAVRPLPPLPFRLDPDGTFVALGDYQEPVGPSFWDMEL